MSAVKFWECLLFLPAIVNRDGTRYTQTGEYRTNPEDIYPSNPTDDDVSSGSSSERSTSGGYSIFHTHLPTAYPTQDQDSPGTSDNPENPPITSKENESLCFPMAICLQKHLWSSWVTGTHLCVDCLLSLEVGDLMWGGGLLRLSVPCMHRLLPPIIFVHLLLCFAYLGRSSAILEVFLEEFFLFSCLRDVVTTQAWHGSCFYFYMFLSCSYPPLDKIVFIQLGS